MSVYKLKMTLAHSPGGDADAIALEATRSTNLRATSPWGLTKPVHFQVKQPLAPLTDMPMCPGYPLFSRRLIDALERAGASGHLRYDVVFEDLTGAMLEDGEQFQLLQVLDFREVLDLEKSTVRMSHRRPGRISMVMTPVLRPPEGGFPPLFLLKEGGIGGTLVNEAAKLEIERMVPGPRGLKFDPIQVTSEEGPPSMS